MSEAVDWQRAQRLRGDFRNVAGDWTIPQDWDSYSDANHDLWWRLYARQMELVPDYADAAYLTALDFFDFDRRIPRFDATNAVLRDRTGWQIVGVPGLLPNEIFFDHLAARRFPVTVWMREPEEFDYIVEPDLFHDFFGHVPLLAHPAFADFMELYGRRGREAVALDGMTMLARLYWYTVEFGLMRTTSGPRAFGAGILSSPGETRYAIDDPHPNRVDFDLPRCLRTDYKIDEFQKTYFVLDSYEQLFEALENADLALVYDAWRHRPGLDPSRVLPLA